MIFFLQLWKKHTFQTCRKFLPFFSFDILHFKWMRTHVTPRDLASVSYLERQCGKWEVNVSLADNKLTWFSRLVNFTELKLKPENPVAVRNISKGVQMFALPINKGDRVRLSILADPGWLVVWNIFFPYIGNFIIPTDFHSIIFQRGWYTQPPTSDKSLRAEATIRDWAHPATRLGWMSKQHPKYFDDEKPGVTTLVTLVEPGSQWLSAVPVAFCGCAAWGFKKIQSQYKTFQNGSKWGMGLFDFEVKSCHLSLDPSLPLSLLWIRAAFEMGGKMW